MSVPTRLSILERAEHYLQEVGYAGFSFRTVAADLGMKSASVHYHFKTKEELSIALLDNYRKKFEQWAALHSCAQSAKADLTDWFGYWSGLCRKGAICPGGAFSAELTGLPKRVCAALRELQEAERRWLIAALIRGRKCRQVQAHGRAEDQANLLLAALQGGVQLARVTGNPKTFGAVLEQLKHAVFR